MKLAENLKIIIAAGVMAACAVPAHSQNTTSGYGFLDIPVSSHVHSLGGVNSALIDNDIMLVDQNPALMGPEIGMQAAAGYMHYMSSGNFGGVKFGMAAGDRAAWTAGIRYLNYGTFDGYLPDGTPNGTFSPTDIVFEGSYSHDITERLRGGVNARMVYSNYERYNAFAMSVDIGINYYNEENDLSFSAVLTNMGGQIKRFDKEYNRLPFDFRLGYMQTIGNSPFQISINAWHLTRWKLPYYSHDKNNPDNQQSVKSGFFNDFFRHLVFGLQYSPSDRFYIALGYNHKTRTDMSAYQRNFLSGFSLGAGIKVRTFGIGISYSAPHKLASTLMLNLNWLIRE